MALSLPPDPYKILGVLKDAKLPEIRSAHRKLVLKCHPDKVQDAALKAIKQDEFQKVQQAYELLSDDNRRVQYDDQVKLFELRKEMGRGVPTARSNPFEYEVKTAEPRPSTYAPRPTTSKPSTTSKSAPSSRPYERPAPRSYEDLYEELPRPPARASKSQEYERKRPSAREEEKERDRLRRERKEDEEREKERAKRSDKSKKRDKERDKDKERKRASEEKYSRAQAAYVEEEESDDYHVPSKTRSSDKKVKQRMEEEIRMREDAARAAEKARKEESERTRKMNDHKDFAAQYMQAARRKAQPVEDDFEPRPMRRAETFAAPSPQYNIRYATPTTPNLGRYSDEEETPRRSSARTSTRRASEAPQSSRSRDSPKTSSKESRRSPTSHAKDPYIVEPPSPPPIKKPTLQSHKSAPPVVPASRKEPARSKTMQSQYVRESATTPPLPRASTFQSGDRSRGSSKLKVQHGYSSDSSESDSPAYTPAPKTRSPSPRHRHAPEPTRYIIDKGRTVPVRSHREELREDNYRDPRDRSESPRGVRHNTEHTRPPLTRTSGTSSSRQTPRSNSTSQAYYPPDPPEPVSMPVRPKMPPREQTQYRTTASKTPGVNYNEVKYAPNYGPNDVVYNEQYRREPHRGYDSYPSVRGERFAVHT